MNTKQIAAVLDPYAHDDYAELVSNSIIGEYGVTHQASDVHVRSIVRETRGLTRIPRAELYDRAMGYIRRYYGIV